MGIKQREQTARNQAEYNRHSDRNGENVAAVGLSLSRLFPTRLRSITRQVTGIRHKPSIVADVFALPEPKRELPPFACQIFPQESVTGPELFLAESFLDERNKVADILSTFDLPNPESNLEFLFDR
jgi:hypothetical protein